jgi:hypothetical protein
MTALMSIAVDTAVGVWKTGHHAVAQTSAAQRAAHSVELRAWLVAATPAEAEELQASEQKLANVKVNATEARRAIEHLTRLRSKHVTSAGEALVRAAYDCVLNGRHHPIWDLWRKRESIVSVALSDEGLAGLREVLLQVKGYGALTADDDRAGYELALDMTTTTPLSDDPDAVGASQDYAAWLRQAAFERGKPAASKVSRCSSHKVRHRPLVPLTVDVTGIA